MIFCHPSRYHRQARTTVQCHQCISRTVFLWETLKFEHSQNQNHRLCGNQTRSTTLCRRAMFDFDHVTGGAPDRAIYSRAIILLQLFDRKQLRRRLALILNYNQTASNWISSVKLTIFVAVSCETTFEVKNRIKKINWGACWSVSCLIWPKIYGSTWTYISSWHWNVRLFALQIRYVCCFWTIVDNNMILNWKTFNYVAARYPRVTSEIWISTPEERQGGSLHASSFSVCCLLRC